MVMLSPWVRSLSKTGSPCYRLCLNGGRLQPEPICKFGRIPLLLNFQAGFCDGNPFARTTIHRRADNVRQASGRMRKLCQTRQSDFHLCIHLIQRGADVYPVELSGILAFKYSRFFWGAHLGGAHPGDGRDSMRGARPVRQWGPYRTADNRGDDTVMVDGGVGDSDDSGLRSIDLATLSGVLRVCDVELLLLDGNGPRAAFASRVHEEALFCSISCGFHCRGRFMLPPDWAMLGICMRPMKP